MSDTDFKVLTTCCNEFRPYGQVYSTYDHERNGPTVWRKDYCIAGFGCRAGQTPTKDK